MSTGRRARNATPRNNQLDISGTASMMGGSRPANDADAQPQQSKAIKANQKKTTTNQNAKDEGVEITFLQNRNRDPRQETCTDVSSVTGEVITYAVFKGCGIDDPIICIDWNADALAAFLTYVQQQRPPWFPAGNDTVQALKQSIITRIRTVGNAQMQTFGTTLVAPLTLEQFAVVKDNIRDLMFFQEVVAAYGRWAAAVAARNERTPVGPIGHVGVVTEGKPPLRATGDVVGLLNAAGAPAPGVQLFE